MNHNFADKILEDSSRCFYFPILKLSKLRKLQIIDQILI